MQLSNLSRRPPCPGKILPVSLMPAFLFNKDSSKSPAVAKTDITSENARINIIQFIFMEISV